MKKFFLLVVCLILQSCEVYKLPVYQYVSIDYSSDYEVNLRIANEVVKYNPQYINSIASESKVYPANSIMFSIEQNLPQKEVRFKIAYDINNEKIVSDLDSLKANYNRAIHKLVETHISKTEVFTALSEPGALWIKDILSPSPSIAIEQATNDFRQELKNSNFTSTSASLFDNLGSLSSSDFIRGEYYDKFKGLPAQVVLVYTAQFSKRENRPYIYITFTLEEDKWKVMHFAIV